MAKKTTQYTKNRNRILRYIKRHGVKEYFDLYIPTERELRKQGISGKQLSSLTRKVKQITPEYIKEKGKTSITETQENEQESQNILESGI